MKRFYLLNTLGLGSGDLCVVDSFVEGLKDRSYMAVMGERIGDLYPKDAVIRVSPTRKGIRLAPLLGNTESVIMVSTAIVDIIKRHTEGVDVEYLPFTLLDPRGRVRSKDYWIVNPLVWVDCLDHVKSGTEYAKDEPAEIVGVERYVIDPMKVDTAPPLFRIPGIHGEYVIGYDIAVELHQKYENVGWKKLPFSNEV